MSGGARRAALALHALSEADQQWMIEHLPAQTSARLKPLLDEITELGLPAGAPDLVAQAGLRPANVVVASAPAAIKFEDIGAERLAQVLRAESIDVVEAVLGLGGAPARSDVLLRIKHRRPVTGAARSLARRPAPQFAASLRAAVEAQALRVPAHDPVSNEPRLHGTRERMARWIGRVAAWK